MTKKSCNLCFHKDVCYAMGNWPERAETCSKYAPDVEKVVHGEWVEQKSNDGFKPLYRCSVCNKILIGYSDPSKVPYCHCGAKMDGGIKE